MTENFAIKRLKIINIIIETDRTKTFVLQPLDNWKLIYKSGQFLTLVFYTKYGEKRRSYSISSSPIINEPLSITIKKVDNGEFSRLLISHAKIGDILLSAGISGLFTLPENINAIQQYFFIAAGSGITPCFSMIKTILAKSESEIILIYSNRSPEDSIFYKPIQKLQEKYPGKFITHFLFSNSYDVTKSRLSNWLLKQLLDKYLKVSAVHTLFYLCGPFEFMQMAEITISATVPKKHILKENYSTLPRLIIPKPPDIESRQVTINVSNKIYTLTVQYPFSILATAKANKIMLPFSCEAGRCGSCVANCISGKIWMAYNEVLTDEEVAAGRVLLCQSYPIGGDVEVQV